MRERETERPVLWSPVMQRKIYMQPSFWLFNWNCTCILRSWCLWFEFICSVYLVRLIFLTAMQFVHISWLSFLWVYEFTLWMVIFFMRTFISISILNRWMSRRCYRTDTQFARGRDREGERERAKERTLKIQMQTIKMILLKRIVQILDGVATNRAILEIESIPSRVPLLGVSFCLFVAVDVFVFFSFLHIVILCIVSTI